MVTSRSIAGSPFLGCRRAARGQTCASRSSSARCEATKTLPPGSGPQRSSCGNGRPRVSSVRIAPSGAPLTVSVPPSVHTASAGAATTGLTSSAPGGRYRRSRDERAHVLRYGKGDERSDLHLAASPARASRGQAAGLASSSREGARPRCTRARRRTRSPGPRERAGARRSRTVIRSAQARSSLIGGAPGPWAGPDTAARSCPW